MTIQMPSSVLPQVESSGAIPKPGEALRGRDILCFGHDWSGDPLSKTHVMRLLARDNRVLWINSIGYRFPTASKRDIGRVFRKLLAAMKPIQEVEPNLFVMNPIAIPAHGIRRIRSVNRFLMRWQVRRAMKRLGFRQPINWICNPAAGFLAGTLGEERVIYYCVDEYTAFSDVPSASLAELENGLLDRADLVIVSSERLYESKRQRNSHTVLVRHGVDHRHFREALSAGTTVPDEIASLPRPVIGYFGLLSPDWIDVELLAHVARCFPQGSVVLIGKQAMDLSALQAMPNVHLLGRKPYQTLPAYCKGFDVGVVPFPISQVTLNSNPLKAREYLAAGLPVVSTAIPEVEHLGQCLIASHRDQFVERIRTAMAEPGPARCRSDAIGHESWEARVEEIRSHFSAMEAARV
jgi:glycosyltransferase involved in cell wall biosynthesis